MRNFKIYESTFENINFECDFFSSLKEDYREFLDWTKKKAKEKCFIAKSNAEIIGFLYVKLENEEMETEPAFPSKKRLKIGTFKIIPHGTRLGERFLKKTFDIAMGNGVQEIYATVFPKHEGLIRLFKEYGLEKQASKKSSNGLEDVYIKSLDTKISVSISTLHAYPRIQLATSHCYLLGIYPKYHTQLFPDSKLNTENFDIVQDTSHTNSIHKVYITKIKLANDFKKNDVLLIYRTTEEGKNAEHTSVATSVCVIEEVENICDYSSEADFIKDISKYSVFKESELGDFYRDKKYPYVIKMLYNIALTKRITRHDLVEKIGLNRNDYWGCMPLEKEQFIDILNIGMGGKFENYIIN